MKRLITRENFVKKPEEFFIDQIYITNFIDMTTINQFHKVNSCYNKCMTNNSNMYKSKNF